MPDDRGNRPWRVVVANGEERAPLVEDYITEDEAQAHAKRANADAEALGIAARYTVEAKP